LDAVAGLQTFTFDPDFNSITSLSWVNPVSHSLMFDNIVVGLAAPAVALTTDSGRSSSDHITNVGTLNVTGAEAGALVEYSTDGGNSWTSSFAAVEGANNVLVRQTDVAGNHSDVTSFSFTLDTTPSQAPVINGITVDTRTGSAVATVDGT